MNARSDALIDDTAGGLGAPSQHRIDREGRLGFGLGTALVVAGGLVAAVTGPLDLARGSWLAAYLVLVCGVAQCCLAAQDRVLHDAGASPARLRTTLAGWNLGNALVIAGTLAVAPVVVVLFRIGLGLLMVSIPVGLVLAHLRAAA